MIIKNYHQTEKSASQLTKTSFLIQCGTVPHILSHNSSHDATSQTHLLEKFHI